jgi:hypothetical protein
MVVRSVHTICEVMHLVSDDEARATGAGTRDSALFAIRWSCPNVPYLK